MHLKYYDRVSKYINISVMLRIDDIICYDNEIKVILEDENSALRDLNNYAVY